MLNRIVEDSMKKFEQCTLCLSKVVRPVICMKGHLFCRDCLVENLVEQKKEKTRELSDYEANQLKEKKLQEKKELDEKLKLQKKFEENLHSVPLTKERDKYERIQEEDQKNKLKVIDSLKEHKTDPETKKDWIKTSFWKSELQTKPDVPNIEKKAQKPDPRLKCPSHVCEDHFIRLKDTVNIKIQEDEKGEYFVILI